MAELNRIRLLLSVSLMIFPAHALDVYLSSAHENFKQQSEINTNIIFGEKIYCGTLNQLSYRAGLGKSKVIVYIIVRSRFVEIISHAARDIRLQIAEELKQTHCELVFLGIENFDGDEHYLISAFIVDTFRTSRNETNITIATIGEDHFDHYYQGHVRNIEKYEENAEICGGNLLALLRSIPHGAFAPVGSNEKEIRLYGYYPTVKEVTWPVHVADGKYSPDENVNLSDWKYDLFRCPNEQVYLLILGGKEYSAFFRSKGRSLKRKAMKGIGNVMSKINEVLLILGAFNFDWTEINIVTQIILKHSEQGQTSGHNVYTCGYGMFNTNYMNLYENSSRSLLQPPNSHVSELIKVLMKGEAKKRAINVYYSDNGWWPLEIPINLGNGKYVRESRFDNLTFPGINQKIAFIVYDSAEINDPIDHSEVSRSVSRLKRSDICVVLIEAINFGLHDIHIIAEWIDSHRGAINSEQIAVLGGGIFDTIFQSESTTYNRFFNIKKSEVIAIRDAYVKSANRKRVFVANIHDPNFEAWSYLMQATVNGIYEPDLTPDKNMFDTTVEKNVFFIITSANFFHQISKSKNVTLLISLLKEDIKKQFPSSDWNVFLVGLDNFGEKDSHLFAELVKMQTHGERSLAKFVLTFSYGIDRTLYQYKDTEPFPMENHLRVQSRIIALFKLACRLPDGTSLPDSNRF